MRREVRWYHRALRLTWRVNVIVLCWLVPSFVDVPAEVADPWRATCGAALVAALAAWGSTQGRSAKKDRQDNGTE